MRRIWPRVRSFMRATEEGGVSLLLSVQDELRKKGATRDFGVSARPRTRALARESEFTRKDSLRRRITAGLDRVIPRKGIGIRSGGGNPARRSRGSRSCRRTPDTRGAGYEGLILTDF